MSSTPRPARRPLTLRLIRAAMAGTLVLPSLAACGNDNKPADQYANCVDRNNVVVDDKYCDDDSSGGGGGGGGGGFFFLWMGPSLFSPGYSVPAGSRNYINPRDSSARARAGLPSAGKVAGSSVRSGGIGSGSSGGKSSGS